MDHRLAPDVIWTEVVDVLRQDRPRLRIAEHSASRLVTEWVRVYQPHGAPRLGATSGPVVTRDVITLRGANPYQVDVDVQIVELRGDAPPWPLGADARLPFWLEGRRARLQHALDEHLRAREQPAR